MPLHAKANAKNPPTAAIAKIRLRGAYRLPVTIVDTGKITLGGACRLPVQTVSADTGKIRLGGACRLLVAGG
jgi:hypothetical protein